MFVEQIGKDLRAKLGSIEQIVGQRRAANGIDNVALPFENFANSNELPLAPIDTGLLGSSRINTPRGPVALADIAPGQEVLSRTGNVASVKHVLPVETSSTALRVRAPYFGANQDLIIGTNHHLEITSEIAEYMFGEATIRVPAWVFKDNSKVLHHELLRDDRMYQLQLDNEEGFVLGDCAVAPLLTALKTTKCLNDAEARAFATERRIGQYN
jgi:hypothetical protein